MTCKPGVEILHLPNPLPLLLGLTQDHSAQGNPRDATATQEAEGHVDGQAGAEGGAGPPRSQQQVTPGQDGLSAKPVDPGERWVVSVGDAAKASDSAACRAKG